MAVQDRKVDRDAGIAVMLVTFQVDNVPASQSNVEFRSVRLPANTDWELVSAHAHARLAGGTAPQVSVQDDGVNVTALTTVVAGAQTLMVLSPTTVRIAGGSELQLNADTIAGETLDDLTVTCYVRPLYLYGRQAAATPT